MRTHAGGRRAAVAGVAALIGTALVVVALAGMPSPTGAAAVVRATDAVHAVHAGRSAPDTSTGWKVQARPLPPLQTLSTVSCPTVNDCLAVASNGLERITDGTNWVQEARPPGLAGGAFGGVCGSVSSCIVWGRNADGGPQVLASEDGGQTWSPLTLPSWVGTLGSLACPTAEDCYGTVANRTDNDPLQILVTTDGGGSWTSDSVPAGTVLTGVIDCPSVATCQALATVDSTTSAVVSTTDGTTWSTRVLTGVTGLTALSCLSATSCTAVGIETGNLDAEAIATSDGWGTWLAQPSIANARGDGALYPEAVACPSTQVCVAAGVGIVSTQDGGAQWNFVVPRTADYSESVACPSSSVCYVPDSLGVEKSVDGGVTWTEQAPPLQGTPVTGIACPTTSTCVTVGRSNPSSAQATALRTGDGGVTWTNVPLPAGMSMTGVTCVSGTATCVAWGTAASDGTAVEARSTDGGQTWLPVAVPDGTPPITDVSCSSTTCVLVAAPEVLTSSDGGVTWTVVTAPDSSDLSAVSCATPTNCVAIGKVVDRSVDGGATWTEVTLPSSLDLDVLSHISCPSVQFCVATGMHVVSRTSDYIVSDGVIAVTRDGGSVWSDAELTASAPLGAVSCASASICWATNGYLQMIYTTNGAMSWGQEDVQGGLTSGVPPGGISCPSVDDCWAVANGTDRADGSALLQNSGPLPAPSGYWEVASDGGIFAFGSATFHGSMGGQPLNRPIVGMAATPDGGGYWEVASDGGIFAFGDAVFYGSTGNITLNEPIVGMASTPDGHGYWLVASDGGIFAFGDAVFYGSTGNIVLHEPIVGMASTPDGYGYWLVASDGGIFSFGDASFEGSMGGTNLGEPLVAMAGAGAPGGGYWLTASDGGIFAFGSASFFGSAGDIALRDPVVGIDGTLDAGGYWQFASDGGVFTYGDAPFLGSMGGTPLNAPVVGGQGI